MKAKRSLGLVFGFALVVAACGGATTDEAQPAPSQADQPSPAVPADTSAPQGTAVPVTTAETPSATEVASPGPASLFDYDLTLGKSTFEDGKVYGRPMVMLAPAPLSERIERSDAVLVVDVLKIGEPHLNASDDVWWPPLHTEDPTVLRPQIGFYVEVSLVSVLKVRDTETTYARDFPTESDRSDFGAVHPAREVPPLPDVDDSFRLWVDGGIAVVTVTAEAWNTYLDEWSSPPSNHIHSDEPDAGPEDVPDLFKMDYGGLPGMNLSKGGRYVVFLAAVDVPQRDGSTDRVWTGGYSTQRAQLLLDPDRDLLVAADGSEEFSIEDFLDAFRSAMGSDTEPSAYRPLAMDALVPSAP